MIQIVSKAYAISPSCTNNEPDDNGFLQISATNGDRFHYSIGNTFDDNSGANTYTNATAITTTPITTPAILTNPGSDTEYTIRIYKGPSCFKDVVVILKPQTCVQGCECTEYMYLNEISHGGSIHKFALDADYDASSDPATAIIGTEVGNPWYNNFANREALSFPHGLGIDINGFLYIGETGSLDNNLNNEIRRFSCDGVPVPSSAFTIPRTAGSNFASNENTLYVNYNDDSDPSTSTWITAYDLCDGSLLGYYCLDSLGQDWGLQLLEDGTMLVSSDKRDYNSSVIIQ